MNKAQQLLEKYAVLNYGKPSDGNKIVKSSITKTRKYGLEVWMLTIKYKDGTTEELPQASEQVARTILATKIKLHN